MTSDSVLQKIETLSANLETLFSDLSECFPQLLNVKKALSADSSSAGEHHSIRAMQEMLTSTRESCSTSRDVEGTFFCGYSEKYTDLFKTLNNQLNSLNVLTSRIDKIKSDSEEMEIIALNAMVISIKSGEKGRAFSCITENLKRLSGDMVNYSGRLIQEENLLIEQISLLQKTYKEVADMQQSVAERSTSGTDVISSVAAHAYDSLDTMIQSAEGVLPPILAAMEGIQMQDIIRQSLDQVVLCFKSLRHVSADVADDTVLDSLAFNVSVLELSRNVVTDVAEHIASTLSVFSHNWNTVRAVLDEVEKERTDFLSRYLNKSGAGAENLFGRLDEVFAGFQSLMSDISHYQAVQKNMVSSCSGISEEVMNLQSIFNNLCPVINKLGHVRISQQIEVAKNPAISSVKDTVTHMDYLITHAADDLDETKKQLIKFVTNVDEIVNRFSSESTKDNQRITEIRNNKTRFFSMLKEFRAGLSNLINGFSVYPDFFNESCAKVDAALQQMQSICAEFNDVGAVISGVHNDTKTMLEGRLSSIGQSEWHIHDDELRELITHFTITAHKEQAGAIGGFDIEHGGSAGEITLF